MKQVRGTVNAVEIIGWLGADPELRLTPNGSKVCRFSVATKRVAGRDSEGHLEYETDWISIETWDRLADQCSSYLHKGSRARISGNLRNDSWTDRESGQTRYKTYVRANSVMFLGSRAEQPETATEEEEEALDHIPF
jgi:single-strand DNA-binding protein